MRSRPSSSSRASWHQEVRDLRLGRGVERGQRLVEDDHRRARPRAPGRSRCAAAGRPRTRAGSRRAAPAGRPTCSRSSATRAAPLCARREPEDGEARRRSARRPCRRGLSDENGFWNTICRRASSRGRAPRVSGRTSRPSNRIVPESGARPSRRPPARASTCRSPTRRRGRRSGRVRRRGSRRRRHGPGRPRAARTRRRRRRARGRSTRSSGAERVDGAGERRVRSTGTSGGTASRQQCSSAYGQRGWNAQPGGMLRGVGGAPGIATSGSVGRLRMRQRVEEPARVRVPRVAEHVVRGRRPRRPGPRRRPRRGRRSPRARRGRA